jgi:uncharacterized protein involved in exopolysaccharide biosynthesis
MSDPDRHSLSRWWPMLAAIPLGALCGGAYALAAPASYQANAYVMVVPEGGAEASTAVDFAQAYGRIITQPEILLGASARTGVSVAQLTARVEAVTSPDAPMVQVTGTARSAGQAADEANAVSRALVDFGNATSKQTGVKLLSFASAAAPDNPSSPSKSIDLAVGTAAGLLIGGLVLMARQTTDGRPAGGQPADGQSTGSDAPAELPEQTGAKAGR